MLTGKQVRVRFSRDAIVPQYLDVNDSAWQELAGVLLEIYRHAQDRTRGELEDEIKESFGNDPTQLVHQGLAKLLEDRCEFETVSEHPPEELRDAVFRAAANWRRQPAPPGVLLHQPLPRMELLQEVGRALGIAAETVDHGLFADLKSEQRLMQFKDISVEHLLQRYNVALAQSVLLRSTAVHVEVRNEPPQRYRQLLRLVKFHRLVCDTDRTGPNSYTLHLDGPLSLFSATQKYGLQLALFLPAVLLCQDYEVRGELRWGPQKKPKQFILRKSDGLVSHLTDAGMFVPPELQMFVELFRKKIADWEIHDETEMLPLDTGFWIPDFRLVQRETGKCVYLEVLGFWRRASVEKHLERLRRHVKAPFVLAVSEQLRIEDEELADFPAGIHRFRQMPLPDEVVRLAELI